MKKDRFTILTNNDITWDLPLWYETIKSLRNKYDFSAGLYVFPDVLQEADSGIQVPLWYLNTYGFKNFCMLSLFAIVRYLKFVLKTGIYDFDSLGRYFNIPVYHFQSPNSEEVIGKLKKDRPYIGLILLTHILKNEILDIEGLDFINMHAGKLPDCGGVMPYFYSKIHNIKPTLTFYKVNRKVNSGLIIKTYNYKNNNASMVKYYIDVFKKYPRVISDVIRRFTKEKNALKNIKSSRLFSYPTKKEFFEYKNGGFKIIDFRDILDK